MWYHGFAAQDERKRMSGISLRTTVDIERMRLEVGIRPIAASKPSCCHARMGADNVRRILVSKRGSEWRDVGRS